MTLHDVDLAKIDPCPGCGTPVRRFASVPIAGSGLDAERSGPWWCAHCIQAKTTRARAGVITLPDVDRFSEAEPALL